MTTSPCSACGHETSGRRKHRPDLCGPCYAWKPVGWWNDLPGVLARVGIASALLLALPVSATEQRADYRAATGVTLGPTTPTWGESGYVYASALPAVGLGGGEYLTEGSEGTDNEYDWLDGPHGCDPFTSCYDADSNDLWSSPAIDMAADPDRYSIKCSAVLHPIDSWEMLYPWTDLGPGYPVDSVNSACGLGRAWDGVAGRTYQAWISTLNSWEWLRTIVRLTCGTVVKTWDSTVGGPMPAIALGSNQRCKVELDVNSNQTFDHASRVAYTVTVGANHWPTPQQGGGCGLGIELLAVLPLLRAWRKR